MKIYKRDYLVFSLGITIIVMNIANVIVNNNQVTEGEKLAEIREEIKQVKQENIMLSDKILEESSYSYLSKKAQTLGYGEAVQSDYLYLK